jgi:protein AbiQ
VANNKLQFYTVTDDYIEFLQKIEPKIQNNRRGNRQRPYVGVILTMGIHNYFAPLSSYKPQHDKINNNTIFKIYGKDKTEKLAVLKLNNMFPVLPTVIARMDFNKEEYHYKRLLLKEYSYIIKHQKAIQDRARKLYNDVMKGDKFYSTICCNFALLEQEYVKFAN